MRTEFHPGLPVIIGLLVSNCLAATPEFAVVSIRPSAEPVAFEHDGKTELSAIGLRMRDVTAATCIKWAYGVQDSQIVGPRWLQSDHFDIAARTDSPTEIEQMKLMMQNMLTDRFQLVFRRERREMKAYELKVAKGGHKLHESAANSVPDRQNSAIGTIARAITMQEFADFIAGPLNTPVLDATGLKGRYDFNLDFSTYIPADEHSMKPDYIDENGIIANALQGELGLKLDMRKTTVEVMVIERVEKPSEN
jgi:uncharacterized protein (TIGR03435 family)